MQRVQGTTQRHADVFPAGMRQVFLGIHRTLEVARGSVKQSTSVLQLSAEFSLLQMLHLLQSFKQKNQEKTLATVCMNDDNDLRQIVFIIY